MACHLSTTDDRIRQLQNNPCQIYAILTLENEFNGNFEVFQKY